MNQPNFEQAEVITKPQTEQSEIPAQLQAETVNDGETTASFGKFKSAEALLNAYNSLQAEFTKRCQRIKELEANAAVDKASEKPAPTEKLQPAGNPFDGITEEDKNNFIKGYLKEIMGAKSKAIVMDGLGTGVKTPVRKPKTVEEAGRLAKDLLGK